MTIRQRCIQNSVIYHVFILVFALIFIKISIREASMNNIRPVQDERGRRANSRSRSRERSYEPVKKNKN